MKKLILIFILCFSFLGIGGEICEAQDIPEQPSTKDIFINEGARTGDDGKRDIFSTTSLKDFTIYNLGDGYAEDTEEVKGEFLFKNTVKRVLKYFNKLIVTVAVLFTVWSGMNLILSRGEEEEFAKRRRHIYGLAIGFMILALASVIVDKIFFGVTGEALLSTENATIFSKEGISQLRGIFKYFSSFGVVAGVAFIIFSAIKMIIAGGEDEAQISKLKRRIVFTVVGIIVLVSTEKTIGLFTGKEGKLAIPDAGDSVEFMVELINFILGFIGILAVFALIYGGIRLITNFGQDEQSVEEAKKVVISAAIGLIVAFSAWTIMYAFLVH